MPVATFPLRINWLPSSRESTIAVAIAAEGCGFEGLGICDSPRGVELYGAIEAALAATDHLAVGSNVTNPVTRPWHVHASAMRSMLEHGRRCFLGFGSGDSAVRTHGGRPATVDEMRSCLERLKVCVEDPAPLLVAASGPRMGHLAVDLADGVVAGVGTSSVAMHAILGEADRPAERWATLRMAIGRDEDHVRQLREQVRPRAISAARFAFASTFDGKDVPERFQRRLREGFRGYDFDAHGIAGDTANSALFRSWPEIENYLVDRFAIVDTAPRACERLVDLGRAGFTGAYLSILFEDPVAEIERVGAALREGGLLP